MGRQKMAGKHRAENTASGLSTSEQHRGAGSSDTASKGKHRATGEDTQIIRTAGSDLPRRDGTDGGPTYR
jgi:hypothetical protein